MTKYDLNTQNIDKLFGVWGLFLYASILFTGNIDTCKEYFCYNNFPVTLVLVTVVSMFWCIRYIIYIIHTFYVQPLKVENVNHEWFVYNQKFGELDSKYIWNWKGRSYEGSYK